MVDVFQLLVGGLSLGAVYALVAVGFVIIYKSTGVLNFAQGGLLMIGAYCAWHAINVWNLSFVLALIFAMVATGLVGVIAQKLVIQKMIGRPEFTVIMTTWALLIVLEQLPPTIWGYDYLVLGDPFGLSRVNLAGVSIFSIDLWTLILGGTVVAALLLFFRFSRMGLAMRAVADDQEVALAQGINPNTVFAAAWFIAGCVAAIAGVMLAGGSRLVSPELSIVALSAFPAIVLGGIDSEVGAVLGGLIIGVVQVLTSAYAPAYAPWLGQNFHIVLPFLLLVCVLMVRPYGMFGKKAAGRV